MSAQRRSSGDLLRRHRLAAGLSQAELAERAGLSRRGVSDIERGIIRAPHQDTLARLAEALQLAAAERVAFEATARGRRIEQFPEPHPSRQNLGGAQPPLVGRHQELALIDQHLAGATTPLLVFAGEPGIGKSRLLAAATPRASARGWRVIAGGCTRRSGQAPFEPFVSALAREVRLTPPARQRLDLQGCGWLARLLPELLITQLAPAPAWTLPPAQERRLMFGAVARYLANVAGPAGTLLVVDDLQWAGTDALDLLAELMREPPETNASPIRVIAAYRTTEARPSDPLVRLLADLQGADLVTQALLAPLGGQDAAMLLDEMLANEIRSPAIAVAGQETKPPLPDNVREEVLRRAEGIPFYLVSAVRALLAAEENEEDGRRLWRVPWTVAQSIRARLAELPARACC